MAVFSHSRYSYAKSLFDPNGVAYLGEPEPFRYRAEKDNIFHTVQDGDTLWGLAGLYFTGVPRPCGLWWLIGWYQPNPIIDPTLRLQAGSTMIIPSMRVVRLYVFNPERRELS